ncbi:MAG TPA: hypothetical protein VMF29_08955, partial [Candidatus Edwardsbacteria bacterium]|nr:hypothetical protein [Candidatus Edwardsbacteria bacterium]
MSTAETTSSQLAALLGGIRSQWRREECSRRALRSLAVVGAWALSLHVVDVAVPLPILVRIGLAPVSAALIVAAIAYPLAPLLARFGLEQAARTVEANHPELRQEISTAWEWPDGRGAGSREQYSPEVIAALSRQAVGRLLALPPGRLVPAETRLACAAAALLAALAVVIIAAPAQFSLTLQRAARPAAACGDWRGAAISPGAARVACGQGVVVSAALKEFTVRWRRADGATGTARSEDGKAELAGITQPTAYRVTAGRMQSPLFPVSVYQPLALAGIAVRVWPPAYTHLPPATSENQGDISGLAGSRVTITATATQPLVRAGIAIDSAGMTEGTVSNDSLIAISFALGRSGGYRLWARSSTGDTLLNATRFAVAVTPDQAPSVELLAPEDDAAPESDMSVAVQGHAADDFGLSALRLACEDRGGTRTLPITRLSGNVVDTTFGYRWDLGGLGLLPGDSLAYWLEAADNDAVAGPQTARSAKRTIRLPSIEDVFKQQQLADSASLETLQQAQPQNRALQQELERLAQAVKENRQLDWQQQAALEQAVQQEQRLLQEMQRSADQALDATRADQARLSVDPEIAAKMAELRQLFDQTATDEMRRAMERMRQAIQQADRAEVERALEKLTLSQDELKRRLDAAIASLKELQQTQQLDLLQQQAGQLLREQQELKTQSAQAGSEAERQQLARRQEQLAKDTDFMGNKLQQQAAELETSEPEVARTLSEASQRLQRQQTASTMRRAGQQIKSQQRDQAQQSQQQAIDDLAQVAGDMQRAASGQRGQRNKAAAQALRQKAAAAIGLSQQQEDLNRRLARTSDDRNDLADRQQSLERAAARLQQDLERMQQRSLPLSPQAGRAMSEAMDRMKSAGQAAAEGQGQQAGEQGQAAQAALNQAAMALMQSAAQAGGSSGSGDMME